MLLLLLLKMIMGIHRDGWILSFRPAFNCIHLFSLLISTGPFLRSFSIDTGSTMVNAWQELDVCRSKQKKLARIGGRIELIYWIEQSIWRLEVYPMRCLSTMASNSNVIKVDFEYTSTVVAKLVVKNSFYLRSLSSIQLVANPVDLPWLHIIHLEVCYPDNIRISGVLSFSVILAVKKIGNVVPVIWVVTNSKTICTILVYSRYFTIFYEYS